jgi:hypothetical protein
MVAVAGRVDKLRLIDDAVDNLVLAREGEKAFKRGPLHCEWVHVWRDRGTGARFHLVAHLLH